MYWKDTSFVSRAILCENVQEQLRLTLRSTHTAHAPFVIPRYEESLCTGKILPSSAGQYYVKCTRTIETYTPLYSHRSRTVCHSEEQGIFVYWKDTSFVSRTMMCNTCYRDASCDSGTTKYNILLTSLTHCCHSEERGIFVY